MAQIFTFIIIKVITSDMDFLKAINPTTTIVIIITKEVRTFMITVTTIEIVVNDTSEDLSIETDKLLTSSIYQEILIRDVIVGYLQNTTEMLDTIGLYIS